MTMMGLISSLGTGEVIIILVIVLVLFGPKQLPKLGRMFGKTMKEVRSGIDDATKEAQVAAEPDAPEAEENVCVSCGEELVSGASFCNACGAKQKEA
jgi:sec-independent protein translocase protein TatA